MKGAMKDETMMYKRDIKISANKLMIWSHRVQRKMNNGDLG